MKIGNLAYAVRSVIGDRDEQQDSVAVLAEEGSLLAVVCDGMGGLAGGALASSMAASTLVEIFKKRNVSEKVSDTYCYSVDVLDERISSLVDDEGERLNAGSTVVSVFVDGSDLNWMSVGDSRLYLLRGDDIVQATRDHNYFLRLNDMRQTIGEEFKPTDGELAKGNALISFIGMGGIEIMDISMNPISLLPGDFALLTSDGLFKVLSDAEIKSIITEAVDVETAADRLLCTVEETCSEDKDNISFILINVEEEKENCDETD